MSELRRVGELEIETDPDFLRKQWRVERAGWMVMALLILAAMAGAFGGGPLARAEARSTTEGIRVEYDRISRKRGNGSLDVHLAAPAVSDTVARLWIDRSWAERAGIERVLPEPASVVSDGGRLVYEFDVEPGRPARFTLEHSATMIGRLRGGVGVVGGDSTSLSTLVLP